jgi:acetoin utilization deacetylase AcuC-like enzyme
MRCAPGIRGYGIRVRRGVLLSHPSSLGHDTGAHPEHAGRIAAIERALQERDAVGWERESSPEAAREQLHAVHPPAYVDAIERACASGGGALDIDTVVSEGSWEAALHGAGGAVRAVELLLGGDADVAASIHRPPGHHAEAARPMGFCLFNNVAVAARHALDRFGAERVLVLDWDVHHGNGTNEAFHATDEVLFASIHESPLYPGTGPASDVGSGRGEGYTVNLPVPARSGDETFCSLVEHVVVPLARAYEPRLILISAGFDAHLEDPLADCRVTDAGFVAMAHGIRRLGAELGAPVGLVLEGGYAVDVLARSLLAVLEALRSAAPPPAPDLPVHPLASAAAGRLAERWPALAAGA